MVSGCGLEDEGEAMLRTLKFLASGPGSPVPLGKVEEEDI